MGSDSWSPNFSHVAYVVESGTAHFDYKRLKADAKPEWRLSSQSARVENILANGLLEETPGFLGRNFLRRCRDRVFLAPILKDGFKGAHTERRLGYFTHNRGIACE